MLGPKSKPISAIGANSSNLSEKPAEPAPLILARGRESFTKVVQEAASAALQIPVLEKLTAFVESVMKPTRTNTTEEWVAARRVASLALGGALKIQRFLIPNLVLPPGLPFPHVSPLRLEWSLVRRKNESDQHAWLKFVGYKWLQSIGAAAPEYEVFYGPCYGDVFAEDLNIVVECGNSSPFRLESIFHGGLRFIALPYQDDLTTRPYLDAYLFHAASLCNFPKEAA